MAKVLKTIIVNCKLHLTVYVSYTLVYVVDSLQETGQDSHLRFDCLYCNLLTDHVIARNVNIGVNCTCIAVGITVQSSYTS